MEHAAGAEDDRVIMNTMQLYEISQWGCALYLGVLAILDWKTKRYLLV